jgi:hypothetical protein
MGRISRRAASSVDWLHAGLARPPRAPHGGGVWSQSKSRRSDPLPSRCEDEDEDEFDDDELEHDDDREQEQETGGSGCSS